MEEPKKAFEILYYWNNGFRFQLDGEVGYSHEITEGQFYRAEEIIRKKGFLLNEEGSIFSDLEFLLDEHYIKINGINEIQGPGSSRYIQIKSGFLTQSYKTKKLVELLDLSLPQ